MTQRTHKHTQSSTSQIKPHRRLMSPSIFRIRSPLDRLLIRITPPPTTTHTHQGPHQAQPKYRFSHEQAKKRGSTAAKNWKNRNLIFSATNSQKINAFELLDSALNEKNNNRGTDGESGVEGVIAAGLVLTRYEVSPNMTTSRSRRKRS